MAPGILASPKAIMDSHHRMWSCQYPIQWVDVESIKIGSGNVNGGICPDKAWDVAIHFKTYGKKSMYINTGWNDEGRMNANNLVMYLCDQMPYQVRLCEYEGNSQQ